MALKTFDPTQVVLTIGGTIANGWEEIELEFDEDKWTFFTDNVNDATRVFNPNDLGTITINAQQTSSINDLLSVASNAKSIIPIVVIDASGRTVYTMTEGSVMKIPTVTFSKGTDLNTRDWPLKGKIDFAFIGGN